MYNRQTGTVSIPSHKQNLLVHTLINVVLRKISMVSLILLWRLKSFWDFISKKGPKRHGRILVNFGLFPDRFLEIFEFWGTNFVSVLSEIGEFRWDPVISKPNPRSLFSTTNDAFRVTLTAWVFFSFVCLLGPSSILGFRRGVLQQITFHVILLLSTLWWDPSIIGSKRPFSSSHVPFSILSVAVVLQGSNQSMVQRAGRNPAAGGSGTARASDHGVLLCYHNRAFGGGRTIYGMASHK